MTPTPSQRARELLAAEYDRKELLGARDRVADGGKLTPVDMAALRAIEAALRLPAGDGWQPIETAPKDHMPRLYLCMGKVVQGFVDVTGQLTVQHEFGWRRMKRKPTHWQPLPAAPRHETGE